MLDKTKSGRTRTILSPAVPSSGVLSINVNEMSEAASVTGFRIRRTLCEMAGATTAVENSTSVTLVSDHGLEREPSALRLLSLAFCSPAPVVTPDVTSTVHCVYAFRLLEPAVRVRAAVFVPESVPAALNVVVPQPHTEVPIEPAKVNVGRVNLSVSVDATSGAFNAKTNDKEEVAADTGLSMVRTVWSNCAVGATTGVDNKMLVVGTFLA